MLHQFIHQFVTHMRLARMLRLEKKTKALRATLDLHSLPHGRVKFGDIEVYRFDASGGYDVTRFLREHPDIKKSLEVDEYRKPRVERVRVSIK